MILKKKKAVSALLKADAKVTDALLANAIHREFSAEVIGMLLEKGGATLDGAIQVMRDDPETYGDRGIQLEFLLYKQEAQETIRQLKETIAELTGQPVNAKPAQQATTENPANAGNAQTLRTGSLLSKLPKL